MHHWKLKQLAALTNLTNQKKEFVCDARRIPSAEAGRGINQNTSNYDQIVKVWTRHFHKSEEKRKYHGIETTRVYNREYNIHNTCDTSDDKNYRLP